MEQCLQLLADVERYPDWYPEVVRNVEILERGKGGEPSTVQTQLHVSWGRLSHDWDLTMAVEVKAPNTVKLTRVASGSGDQGFEVAWHLGHGKATTIEVKLHANIDVPRLLPLGGVGDSLASGFAAAAARELSTGP